MRISLVVAVAENGIIGRAGALPWHLPGDLKWFKSVTMGKPTLMGRKTFESIGRALPGRTNIVITRNADWHADGVVAAASLEAALDVARSEDAEEAMIIGGAQVYGRALERARRIYLTEVHTKAAGDTWFPPLNRADWTESFRERHEAVTGTPAFSFVILDRTPHR